MSESPYYIFGIQRSGTNYFETLLSQNFNVYKMNPRTKSWKHSIDVPKRTKKDIPLFVVHKNPYTWIESITFRNSVDWLKTQSKYPANIKGPYMLGEPKKLNVTNLAKTYAHFYDTWLTKTDDYMKYVVRYEDLLIDDKRNSILDEIRNRFGFVFNPRKKDDWLNPRPGSISQSKDYNREMQNYYQKMKPTRLPPEFIKEINGIIGVNAFKSMNYEML